MTPYEPLPANVLAPLRFDPAMAAYNDFISADLLTKGPPAAKDLYEGLKPVRGASRRAFPIVPALFTRMRYSAIPDALIASLHVETSRLIPGTALIQSVDVEIPDAKVLDLGCVSLPMVNKAGDELVALYKVALKPQSDTTMSPVRVRITARLCNDRKADVDIELKWQTQVDLLKTTSDTGYKWSRPLSAGAKQPPRPSSKDAHTPSLTGPDHTTSGVEPGIIFNFTAPPTVTSNSTFHLHVQCINNTPPTRRFALVSLQPRKPAKDLPRPPDSAHASLVAKLFNAPPLESAKAPDVVDLNPDVRVGPLPPGTSYETNMEFRALREGVLDLGAVRVVDLESRRTVDVRGLPDVVALDVDPGDDIS